MSARDRRIRQLKFIATIFEHSLLEIADTLGYEALTMIFRRVGERVGETVAKRLEGRHSSVEQFCDLLVHDVINPVIGGEGSCDHLGGGRVLIKLGACPYKKAAGFPVRDMSWFCDYTEGLIDAAFGRAFPEANLTVRLDESIARNDGCQTCRFSVGPKD
ncbi:MAG: hypothetical protein Kow0069_25570 [Promethearchaeota archaeon]